MLIHFYNYTWPQTFYKLLKYRDNSAYSFHLPVQKEGSLKQKIIWSHNESGTPIPSQATFSLSGKWWHRTEAQESGGWSTAYVLCDLG